MDTLSPAPPGFIYLKNRSNQPYQDMFDGVTYAFEPGEVKLLSDTEQLPIATFLYTFSAAQVDLEANTGERVLVKQDDPKWDTTFDTKELVELVDRSYGDNPLGKGTGGLRTKATLIPVRGGSRITRAAVPS